MAANPYVLALESLRMTDVARVGGKNASLGELISQLAASGVRVPGGFATTAQAFDDFLVHGKLTERIAAVLAKLDVEDVAALARAGQEIRGWIEAAPLPPELERQIRAYQPWPGSFLDTPVGRLIVLRAAVDPGPADPPGRLVAGRDLRLATADDWLVLEEVQPAGKRPMSGVSYARGRPELKGSA